jgi:UDP-N-acetylmuramoyl-tripeptide--D-alanyl-D-alanine ligase
LINKDSYEIILDAYNANPSSMKVALENFIQLDKTNKIAILGDMYELGEESLAEHKYIVDFLTKNSSFECYFIGKYFFENFEFRETKGESPCRTRDKNEPGKFVASGRPRWR